VTDVQLADRAAIAVAVIDWGKSSDAGSYVPPGVVYLLREHHPASIENHSLRLYSPIELELLGKSSDSYAVSDIKLAGTEATAFLNDSLSARKDGWSLTLTQANGRWSVTNLTFATGAPVGG
jgi:hypothetical protein